MLMFSTRTQLLHSITVFRRAFCHFILVSKMSSRKDVGGARSANNQACAACRHQRRKCNNCPFTPYFPSNRAHQFQNVHRLFGVSNVMKILHSINQDQWPKAMETIQFQADARRNDPVYGCQGIIRGLNEQIEAYSKELDIINQQISFYRQRDQQMKYQHQQQPQKLQNMVASPSMPMPPLGHYQSPNLIDLADVGQMRKTGYYQPFEEYEDLRPLDPKLQTIINGDDAEESSAESTLRETSPLDRATDI